jgi:type I site-specific restriction endonuclease
MGDSAKRALSERDICTKYITPALVAGDKWDQSQIREEVSFTKGRVLVRGKNPLAVKPSAPILSFPTSPHSPRGD